MEGGLPDVVKLGCKVGELTFTYLGLPLGAPFKSSSIWDGVEETFRRRPSMWMRDVTDRIIWKELKNGVSIVISLVCLGAMEVDSFPSDIILNSWVLPKAGMVWVQLDTIHDMMVISLKCFENSIRDKTLWRIVCLSLLWIVWRERNPKIFEDTWKTLEMM
ncbi:hypothetical protein CK203_064822 [Vitis vinifera]|uniref:Reverse transcriptase zinc-binding domain-containing protein n=1 Tax=Vitis vinifera TaxID=29760 RepID=A0A438G728_VITVI|nr:hypothetical protein CK203_064822 [Vitis vinifera]